MAHLGMGKVHVPLQSRLAGLTLGCCRDVHRPGTVLLLPSFPPQDDGCESTSVIYNQPTLGLDLPRLESFRPPFPPSLSLSQLVRPSEFADFRKNPFGDLNQKSTKFLFSIFAIDKLSKKNSINEKYAFST